MPINEYYLLIKQKGLHHAWIEMMNFLEINGIKKFEKKFFKISEIGHYYEMGLAYVNKTNKKNLGKYYTPSDVAKLMSKMLLRYKNINSITDTGCGCGNLIIEFLHALKKQNKSIFNNVVNNIYLFDTDKTALMICKTKIKAIFGKHIVPIIKCGDFLNWKNQLPDNCCVIANPPYCIVRSFKSTWKNLPALKQSHDLYAGFIEKIIRKCTAAVIVSPQSFLVSSKFRVLRNLLSKNCNGEIYSFDNVPSTIFSGKKEGIFNSNASNGVRASISYLVKKTPNSKQKGFKLSHLIRFKSSERAKVLNIKYLQKQLGKKYQNLQKPLKCFAEYEHFVYSIIEKNNILLKDIISVAPTDYAICINSSSRYFTVATKTDLKRNGKYFIYAKDKKSFYILYSLLNSSYCYLFWRMMDGGILFNKSILLNTPLPKLVLTKEIATYVDNMIEHEKEFFVYKKNAGVNQQSVKFPKKYREKLNSMLFTNKINFNLLHMNHEII